MTLSILDLSPAQSLLSDRESFLSEIGEADLDRSIGGVTPGAAVLTAVVIFGAGAGAGMLAYKLFH